VAAFAAGTAKRQQREVEISVERTDGTLVWRAG
jgi:hypothetical protein